MNIIEAVKSGKRFRRKYVIDWYDAARLDIPFAGRVSLCPADFVATDWEIEERYVTITKSQFWEAVATSLKESGFVYHDHIGTREIEFSALEKEMESSKFLKSLVRNLGIEGASYSRC